MNRNTENHEEYVCQKDTACDWCKEEIPRGATCYLVSEEQICEDCYSEYPDMLEGEFKKHFEDL